MLAQEVAAPFDDPNFLFEIKWDGYRALLERGAEPGVRLWSRGGRDLARDLPALAAALEEEVPDRVLLDGEVVALLDGRSDFERLARRAEPIVYVAFDLLSYHGDSLLHLPLRERRARLADKVRPTSRLLLSEGVVGAGTSFFKGIRALGLEGMMAKDLHSPYRPGKRTAEWRKVLNLEEGIFPVLALETGDAGTVVALWLRASDARADPVARVAGLPAAERAWLTREAGAPMPLAGVGRPLWTPPPGLTCRVRYRKTRTGSKLRHPVYAGLVATSAAASAESQADTRESDAGPNPHHPDPDAVPPTPPQDRGMPS